MDSFCIDANVLGTSKHLVCDNGYSWSNSVPDNMWHLSGEIKHLHDRCLDTLFKLSHIEINLKPEKKYVDAMNFIVRDKHQIIPWHDALPQSAHRTFTENLINDVMVAFDKSSKDYYVNTWVPGNDVFKSLQRAKIDFGAYIGLVNKNVNNVRIVETFEPDVSGFAKKVVYNRLASRTGRTTIESGPEILTINREYRNIIKSSFDEGSIVYLDFAGLEARILLYEAGGRCDELDLYGMIIEKILHGEFSRDEVKKAVISELYGSSKHILGKSLGIKGAKLNSFIKKIKGLFRVSELRDRVKQQFAKEGYIENRHGRRILIDEPLNHIFINSYAQSTGVDVVLLGFKMFLDEFMPNEGIRPLYLLHDALILDVRKDIVQKIQDYQWVKVKGYVQQFALKATSF
jgi:hypothetical protein